MNSPVSDTSRGAPGAAAQAAEPARAAAAAQAGAPCEGAGEHRFSARYEERKRALIASCADAASHAGEGATSHAGEGGALDGVSPSRARRLSWKAACALAAALVAVPAAAWAVASNADFFAGAFGEAARTSVAAHDEVIIYDDGKSVTVTYPAREYVEADLGQAERLLGAHVAADPVSVTMGDHVLTVLSTVRDADAMVVHYTLERPGGVTALQWDELTNQGKGAHQPNDAPYYWSFVAGVAEKERQDALASLADLSDEEREAILGSDPFRNYGGGATLVDAEKSTADKLYCYEYLVFAETPAEDAPVTLEVFERTWQALAKPDGGEEMVLAGGDAPVQVIDVPVKDAVPSRALSSAQGGTLDVSPLGIRIGDAAIDHGEGGPTIDAVKKLVVRCKDGSAYVVFDRAADLDNTAYALGRSIFEDDAVWMFNRLVDPDAIERVEVNGRAFS